LFPIRSELAAIKDGAGAVKVGTVLDEIAKLKQLRASAFIAPQAALNDLLVGLKRSADRAHGWRPTAESADAEWKEVVIIRLTLVGDNAGYRAQRWRECLLVAISHAEKEVEVELCPQPDTAGADALYDAYLMRLRQEASGRPCSIGARWKHAAGSEIPSREDTVTLA
jgi:hypothetical protein